MLHSLRELLRKFPYFLNHRSGSNFYKTENVFNEWFKELYDNLRHTYESNHLTKPIQLWVEQETPTNYILHSIIDTKYLKKIKLVRLNPDNTLTDILEEDPENIEIISYEKIDTNNNHYTYYDDTLNDEGESIYTEEEYQELKDTLNTEYKQEEDEVRIHFQYTPTTPNIVDSICMDKFILYMETWDEEDYVKGYPENDTSLDMYSFGEVCFGYTGFWDSSVTGFYRFVDEYPDDDIYDDRIYIDESIFNHDRGLDKIGLFLDVPRLNYKSDVSLEELGNCEPQYFAGLTEPDHHYLGRLLGYTVGRRVLVDDITGDVSSTSFNLHSTALPCLELWKLFGVYSSIVNRETRLCKMINGHKHFQFMVDSDGVDKPVFDAEGHYMRNPEFELMSWEHEDLMCTGAIDSDYYLFASVNNHTPVLGANLLFNLVLMDSLAETPTVEGVIIPYLDGGGEGYEAYDYNISEPEQVISITPNSTWKLGTTGLGDYKQLKFKFKYFNSKSDAIKELTETGGVLIESSDDDDLIISDEISIRILGCDNADYYVNYTTGDDSNNGSSTAPFKTLKQALNKVVNGGLIALQGGEHYSDELLEVPASCTIMGCGRENNIYFSTPTRSIFMLKQGINLTMVNIECHRKCCTYSFMNETIMNHNITNTPVYISFSRNLCKKETSISIDDEMYTTLNDTIITGNLQGDDSTEGLKGKTVNLTIGDVTYNTSITDTAGSFKFNLGKLNSGEYNIIIEFIEDDRYCGITQEYTITVIKDTPILSVESDKTSTIPSGIVTFTGVLTSSQGTPISNAIIGRLTSKSGGAEEWEVYAKTDKTGAFTFTKSWITEGTQTLEISVQETNQYNTVSTMKTINVSSQPIFTISVDKTDPSLDENITFSGVLTTADGVGLDNIPIIYNNEKVATTGVDGSWFHITSFNTVGEHTIYFNADYEGTIITSDTITITVKDTPTLTVTPSVVRAFPYVDVTYNGLLKDYNGDPISDADIIISDYGTVTTGSDGTFSIIKQYSELGSYYIECTYNGDNIHDSIVVKSANVTISNILITRIAVPGKSTTTAEVGDIIAISGRTYYNSGSLTLLTDAGYRKGNYNLSDILKSNNYFIISYTVVDTDIADNIQGFMLKRDSDVSNLYKFTVE